MWLPDLSAATGPTYRALVDALASAIYTGELRPGTRLPTHRLLADLLGVNVSTVTRAYREAARRHLVGGETGRGTYVLGHADSVNLFALPDRGNRQLIDLSVNTPAYPHHHHHSHPDRDLERTLAALQAREGMAHLLQYQSAESWRTHRAAAAHWLAQRGLTPDPAHIVLCCGAQHAVASALAGVCARGDTVLVESYTYPGVHALARQLGLHLHALPMDDAGVRPEALDTALRNGVARVAIFMPTLHNPTTVTMPLARREAIARVVRKHDALIIEEDVYGPLPGRYLPPLAALAPQHVRYVGSLSKCVAPGLRAGFLYDASAREQDLVDQLHTTSWLLNPLMARIATEWIHDGTAERRLAWQRKELRLRHRVMQQAMPAGIAWAQPEESPHAWIALPPGQTASVFCERARKEGLAITPAAIFAANRSLPDRHVRLCVGAASGVGELKTALRTLAALLDR